MSRWDYPPPPVRMSGRSLVERIRQDQQAPVDPATPVVVMVSREGSAPLAQDSGPCRNVSVTSSVRCAFEVGWCWTLAARTLIAWWGRCDATSRVCRGGGP